MHPGLFQQGDEDMLVIGPSDSNVESAFGFKGREFKAHWNAVRKFNHITRIVCRSRGASA